MQGILPSSPVVNPIPLLLHRLIIFYCYVSQNDEDNYTYMSSMDHQDLLDNRSGEQPFAKNSDPANVLLRGPTSEHRSRREPPSATEKVILLASDVMRRVAQQIPVSNVTSQQASAAVAITEHDRFLCALTMATLVVLSYAGFPIVGSRIFRWVILFQPLFIVLITNITLIVQRLLPDNRNNLVRGDKGNNNASLLGDGYAWAEEAGRALKMGLMLQNVIGALFLDCSVYATIVVFDLSLFG